MKKLILTLAVLLWASTCFGAVLLEETFEGSNSGYDNEGWVEDVIEDTGDADPDQTAR